MARTHARVKGKSGSSKPVNADLSFVTITAKEVKELIIQFANKDMKSSEIGIILRDTYAVPNIKKLTGKSIGKILEEAKISQTIPEDLGNLVEKALKLRKHLELNKKDLHNKRGLQLIESKIRRLSGYYKKTNKIPKNWKMK